MKLDKIFESFLEKMTQIELYHRAIHEIADNELIELGKYAESLKENPELSDLSSSGHNMYFYGAKDGVGKLYGQRTLNLNDRIKAVFIHKNKQYQWLLAEAYEIYREFLEELYAFAGFNDKNFWPLSDYGNLHLSELDGKDFDWYLQRVRIDKKKDVVKILKQFRGQFPELVTIENNNKLQVNLKLALLLVEKLRHIIVHNSGLTSDKEQFIQDILREAGLSNNGFPDIDNYNFVARYFGRERSSNSVALLEIRRTDLHPLKAHIDVLGSLTGFLLAHSDLLFECLNARFSEKIHE
jgi:hypothetical protein